MSSANGSVPVPFCRGGSILLLIPHLAKGGAERQFSMLAQGLAVAGWQVHVGYWHKAGAADPKWRHPNLHLHHLSGRSAKDPLLVFRIIRLVATLRPLLIHTWMRQMDLIGGLCGLLFGIPWVIAERSSEPNYRHWRDSWRRWLGSLAYIVAANSRAGANYWKLGYASPPIVVTPNGVRTSDISETAKAKFQLDIPVVVSVGRLIPSKRPSEMIEILADDLRANHFRLVLIGDGPLMNDLQRVRDRLDLSAAVFLLGNLPENEVWSWLRRADVFVSLSEYEGQPNAVMEAMAATCSLVISDIPEHRAFIDSDEALFVDEGNLRTAIASLLTDSKYRNSLAIRARSKIERYTVAEMVTAYDRLYRQIISIHTGS
jgi:glycosyltransferase involved in cell wall biosynthesis